MAVGDGVTLGLTDGEDVAVVVATLFVEVAVEVDVDVDVDVPTCALDIVTVVTASASTTKINDDKLKYFQFCFDIVLIYNL